jgi:hypothetical protein
MEAVGRLMRGESSWMGCYPGDPAHIGTDDEVIDDNQ